LRGHFVKWKILALSSIISASDREHLEKALVECYKQLRKGQKEENDQGLVDILQGKAVEQKKAESPVNFEELEQQIIVFLKNAYAQPAIHICFPRRILSVLLGGSSLNYLNCW